MKHTIIKALFLLFSMSIIVGCAESPSKVVIKDESNLVLHVLKAIEDLEEKTGSDLFGEVVTGNNPRYFRGNTPHRKVIAIEFVDHVNRNDGNAIGVAWRNIRHTKCLIQIERDKIHSNLVAHELLHCKGVEHNNVPGSLMYHAADPENMYITDKTRRALGLL